MLQDPSWIYKPQILKRAVYGSLVALLPVGGPANAVAVHRGLSPAPGRRAGLEGQTHRSALGGLRLSDSDRPGD